jgi:hypothetical protein
MGPRRPHVERESAVKDPNEKPTINPGLAARLVDDGFIITDIDNSEAEGEPFDLSLPEDEPDGK